MSVALPSDAFDPLHLRPEASLNRTCLAALPGAHRPWVGRPAFELLSLAALEQLAVEEGFDAGTSHEGITWSLAAALADQDPTAARVAAVFGQRLGHLIATLTGPATPADGETAWRAAYLRHWAQVEQVWLGGGTTAALGSHLVSAARREAERLGGRVRSIERAPHPGALPLIGAARTHRAPLGKQAIVLDFGHTEAKRALATIRGKRLVRLELLSRRPLPRLAAPPSAGFVLDFVLDTVADTFRTAQQQGELDPRVTVSLASYVFDGRPSDPRSAYARLGEVEHAALEAALSRRTGTSLRLEFVHDGTAAARGLPKPGRAAVILLGTALGVGFSPPRDSLLPVAADLVVVPAQRQPDGA